MRAKATRPKLFYEGAHDGYVLPHMSLSESVLALEPRFMFDAAGMATGAEVAVDTIAQEQADQALNTDSIEDANTPPAAIGTTENLLNALTTVEPVSSRNEIIFIDTSVEDYASLITGINSNAELVFLDSDRDGVEQIADTLADRNDIDAIHIISHGSAGQLELGNTTLNVESMQGKHADELHIVANTLNDTADILIYGCNFAEGDQGKLAADTLAHLTGADIAASNDLTGNINLGGDWDLESQVGKI